MSKRKDCYTDEQKDEVIAHVLVHVACGRFVSRIFREDEITTSGVKMPHVATFWQWVLDAGDDVDDKLVRARERGVEALLDECGEIADDAVNDYLEKVQMREGQEINRWWEYQSENVARSKLRIETRIKLAQMLKPKKYGPKLDLTSGNKPIGLAAELEAARLRALDEVDKKSK